MPDFSVDVKRNDIVVSKPSSGWSVTYRRTGGCSLRSIQCEKILRARN